MLSSNSLSTSKIYVLIPLKAATAIPVPIRTSLSANGCGFGTVLEKSTLGTRACSFGTDCVVAGE